jgi:hypothetical protein
VNVGTRWCSKDIFGRLRREEAEGGEKWTWLVYPAIATTGDELGRKPGDALWPRRVPLSRLQMIQRQRPRWFAACWQQAPEDEQGQYFRPDDWPHWMDLGDAVGLYHAGRMRTLCDKSLLITILVVDWATSSKRTADRTAVGVFYLLPDGCLVVADMRAERVRLEDVVRVLVAPMCKKHEPDVAACEASGFQGAMRMECRHFPEIPEMVALEAGNLPNQKLRRALPAITMGGNGRIYLPSPAPSWLADYKAHLSAFAGTGDEADDEVDVTGYAARLAQQLRQGGASPSSGPCVLTPGREEQKWKGWA